MSKTVAQYIINRLEEEVDHAFCFVGGAAIFLTDALNNSKIKPVFNLHEQACTIAADAYGQFTNKLGLAIVTAGPGTLNALTGVAAAYIDSTPMIILSGQANTTQLSDKNLRSKGIQEVKTAEIVRSITKAVYTIKNANEVPYILEAAIKLAQNGRPGPVWIDIPLNMQSKIIDESNPLDKIIASSFGTIVKRDKYSLEPIIDAFNKAKRPVVFIGNGVRLAHIEKTLLSLINSLGVPVLTTWRAMDLIPEDHPLYCGRPGMIGQRGANSTLQNCDFLLCLGTRLDLASVAFDYKNFAPKATKVIVDVDKAEIDKLDFDKIAIVDSLDNFIIRLDNYCDNNVIPMKDIDWLLECKKASFQPIETIKSDTLSLYQFIEGLTPHLKNRVVAVGSSGCISEVFCQSFKVQESCRIIQSNGLGSMGFGLPAAIGAYYASGKPVICLDGDGSIALNMQELALISGARLPIVIFIINNGGYVSIKNTQDNICGQRHLGIDWGTELYLPDYFKIAKAFDILYCSISSETTCSHLGEILENIDQPIICEVFTDHNHKTQCRTTTIKQPDGTLKVSGLENLWP